MIAALFVDPRGPYANREDVDAWDASRDARQYRGPHAVVAHPPCERWGRYWSGGPSVRSKRKLGDDGGCFDSALHAVRTYGGVLEHPEGSHAFKRFGLKIPMWREGWVGTDSDGYVCCVAQGNYGHRARKLTWLYASNTSLPDLDWSIPAPRSRLDYGFHSKEERANRKHLVAPRVNATRLSARENLVTPEPFAQILISMAKSVNV
jgi:hypothetical protein